MVDIQKGFEAMKEIRDMDGIYFRVKRNGRWENICFSDLTLEEQDQMMQGRSEEWLKSMITILAECLYDAGEFVERRDRE